MRLSKMYLALAIAPMTVAGLTLPGCSTAPPTEETRQNLNDEARTSLNEMKRADPSLNDFLNRGFAYAIFPSVGAGGVGAGGAYGRGQVFQGDRFLGYTDLSQGTVGLELGGRTYSELIVFKDQNAFEDFQHNKLQLAAQAAAIALKAGASTTANFSQGVAVFTRPTGGLMFDASIGGQQFTFKPAESGDTAATRIIGFTRRG